MIDELYEVSTNSIVFWCLSYQFAESLLGFVWFKLKLQKLLSFYYTSVSVELEQWKEVIYTERVRVSAREVLLLLGWRNSGIEAFSSRRGELEDDEEALKWAALEKLPTYNRLRKGLLATSRGVANEIDILTDLGFQERQKLLDRLINVAEEGNEKFLLKLKERIDRVGIEVPTIEVRYERLIVEAEAYVRGRALPTLLNSVTNAVESILISLYILTNKKKHMTILKDVSGIVKPSRMTLLLGPPSSGKTTLLLALSGKLDPNLKVSGKVTYNGHGMDEFVPQRTAAYISQHDVHIGEMTVRETLAFSARCQGVGSRYDLLSELSRREKEAKIKPDPDIDVFMKAVSTGGQQESVVTDYVLKLSCRLLKQYLLLLLINQVASGLFRAIAALGRNMIVANTFGSFALLTLLTLGGFIMSRKDIKSWWIWGYWISPLMYGQNAIMVNEFLGDSWNHFTPNSNKTLGIQVLESRGFFTDAYWYWIGVGALVGFMFLYNIIFTVALTHLNPFDKAQATISEESEDSTTNGTHQEVELPRIASSGESSSRRQKRGMVLPFEPHSITFDEVVYSVDMPQEMKIQGVMEDRLVLLKGVSGAFRPGVLTALMGVSGAGKTTLMDVLAGRKTGGYIDGSIKISGYPKKQETFARISGYCEQNDIHSPHVTVHESLLYSAWLRLPAEVDYNTRKMFIEEVMELVELNPLRNSLVGLPGVNGLSIEQRKRLTIAVELVANPSIIFILSLLGLTPLAERVSFLTEQIAIFTGPTVGGLLNATCGNVTELIIAIFALTTNKIAVVKYSLLGSVLSNLLLVLGTSLLCGGIANIGEEQKYDRRQADVNSLMLLLALLCHLLPLLFTYSAASAELTVEPSLYLSRASSIVMLVAYFAYLIF
ncbi:pleiotropic drug resistance protein 1 [Lathyrus oleraceus]|uniref:pleiotropic drug resistance protein 1 n=1 Tax=Pisum sativum TaxID=3888 RepID=UPI0021D14832|nr:pleiotropic drug resistance protein 1-like [Pisum sativum]